jgi:hypothetical protein
MPLPLDVAFLLDASLRDLQDAELACRNRSANLRKRVGVEVDAWIEQEALALAYHWALEHWDEIHAPRTIDVRPQEILRL